MSSAKQRVGRARMLLVYGADEHKVALLSEVVAHVIRRDRPDRIVFAGPAVFHETVRTHLCETVVPLVDLILDALVVNKPQFTLSVVNAGAASKSDLKIEVSGFSTDIPVLLALISAALEIPIPNDVVASGHIASAGGDVAAVRSVPAKLQAAIEERSIKRIILPDPDHDSSLRVLSPLERDAIGAAMIQGQEHLTVIPVNNVLECMRLVFDELDIVKAGLKRDFLRLDASNDEPSDVISQSVQFFAADGETRFWRVIESAFLAGQNTTVKGLLQIWARYFIRKGAYPTGTGHRLLDLICSLPPAMARLRIKYPLMHPADCIGLSRLACPEDLDDVRHLFDAIAGDGKSNAAKRPLISSDTPAALPKEDTGVETVLNEIGRQKLAATVGLPADTARATYVTPNVTTDSYDEFLNGVTAFFVHLMRHCRGLLPATPNLDAGRADALALLGRTFTRQGGINGAWAECQYGTRGGLRFVFDLMTEQFKAEEIEKRIQLVLKEAIDPLDHETKVAFMTAFLARLAPHLPAEIRNQPPERYVRQYESIIQSYVQSMEKLWDLMKTL